MITYSYFFSSRHISHHRRPHRKHKHHHRKRNDRRDGSPPVKKLSTIFEPDEEVEVERDYNAPQLADCHDPEDPGITFKASPLAYTEDHHEPQIDREHHRHKKHHGRRHGGHRDKSHEKPEVPERLDRRPGRLPSMDEDGVIHDTRVWDSRGQHLEIEHDVSPFVVQSDDSQGHEFEKGLDSEDIARKANEAELKQITKESNKILANDEGASEAPAPNHGDDTDDEEHSVTSALLNGSKQQS